MLLIRTLTYASCIFCQVQDWLYTDGEDANAAEFQERLDQLKAVGDPIFLRFVIFCPIILILPFTVLNLIVFF